MSLTRYVLNIVIEAFGKHRAVSLCKQLQIAPFIFVLTLVSCPAFHTTSGRECLVV